MTCQLPDGLDIHTDLGSPCLTGEGLNIRVVLGEVKRFYLGDVPVSEIYFGKRKVKEARFGSRLVWERPHSQRLVVTNTVHEHTTEVAELGATPIQSVQIGSTLVWQR